MVKHEVNLKVNSIISLWVMLMSAFRVLVNNPF